MGLFLKNLETYLFILFVLCVFHNEFDLRAPLFAMDLGELIASHALYGLGGLAALHGLYLLFKINWGMLGIQRLLEP